MANMMSRDPSDVMKTVRKLKAEKIRCSILHLAAEIHLCRMITKETEGVYKVALDEKHYKDCLWDLIPPPPLTAELSNADLILMGFPLRSRHRIAQLCAWYVMFHLALLC
jgi:transcription initiation factor TFIIH subunit 2